MMSRSAKSGRGIDILSFNEDHLVPVKPPIRTRSTPRTSVILPAFSKGKLTSGQRIHFLKKQNSKRLALSKQQRQLRELQKAEERDAVRVLSVRRKVDFEDIWDLTKEKASKHAETRNQDRDELVSDDDDDDFATQPEIAANHPSARPLLVSPHTSLSRSHTKKRRVTEHATSHSKHRSCAHSETVQNRKSRRTIKPRKRVAVPVSNPVFNPNLEQLVRERRQTSAKTDALPVRRQPFRVVSKSMKNERSPPKRPKAQNAERQALESSDAKVRTRKASTRFSLNITTAERASGTAENSEPIIDLEAQHETVACNSPLSTIKVSTKSRVSHLRSSDLRREKRESSEIPAKNFYGKSQAPTISFRGMIGHIHIPQSKNCKLASRSTELSPPNLEKEPKAHLPESVSTPKSTTSSVREDKHRRRHKTKRKCDSSDDEDDAVDCKSADIRLQPLSVFERQEVRSLTFKVPKQKVMAQVPEANINLNAGDFSGLRGSRWLNDEVINSFVSLVNSRNRAEMGKSESGTCDQTGTISAGEDEIQEVTVSGSKPMEVFRRPRPRTHIFNSFFFPRLTQGGYDYNGVKRWLRKTGQDIKDLDLIMFPINVSNYHWILTAIDLRGKQLMYFDSTLGRDCSETLALLRRWLFDEVADKHGESLAESMEIESWGAIVNPSYLPEQKDGGSCGIFALYMAEYLERGQRPNFEQNNIRVLRERTALFLKHGKLPSS